MKNLIDKSYQHHTLPMFVFVGPNYDVIWRSKNAYIASFNKKPIGPSFTTLSAALGYLSLEYIEGQ